MKKHTKPTAPFGYIAFGKDGSVRESIDKLPGDKDDLEYEIGKRFISALQLLIGENIDIIAGDEFGHDFDMKLNSRTITVQSTEIVARDYLVPLPFEVYRNGTHKYREFVSNGPEEILGVDNQFKDNIILERINLKLKKRYSKPRNPLWLLIWSVQQDFVPFWTSQGESHASRGVSIARAYLKASGAGPFDEIWYFNFLSRPSRIWPY